MQERLATVCKFRYNFTNQTSDTLIIIIIHVDPVMVKPSIHDTTFV